MSPKWNEFAVNCHVREQDLVVVCFCLGVNERQIKIDILWGRDRDFKTHLIVSVCCGFNIACRCVYDIVTSRSAYIIAAFYCIIALG